MKTTVYCTPTERGIHSFYLTYQRKDYFLFRQNFRRGVHDFFSEGVELNQALRIALARRDSAVIRTMEKLPTYIRYVEKEYGIAVLDRTMKMSRRPGRIAS